MHKRKEGINGQSFFHTDQLHTVTVPCLYEKVKIWNGSDYQIGYRPIYLQEPPGQLITYGEVVEGPAIEI